MGSLGTLSLVVVSVHFRNSLLEQEAGSIISYILIFDGLGYM